MTEEIKVHQTGEDATGAVPAGQSALTGGARRSAERKPMVSWAALLQEAVTKPGYIHEAYTRFHSYSIGNQILALFQCFERGLQPGPLATWPRWKELGRHVRKGEKALTLCMPLTCKRRKTIKREDGTEQEEQFAFTHFSLRPLWFTLVQTEGKDYQPASLPEWSEGTALAALKIEREEFQTMDGNTQGYAKRDRKIAVSPVAALPHKTLFNEIAHAILHCDQGDMSDTDQTPRSAAEVEAEAVALLCCESLGLPGAEFSRGYIQSWGQGQAISERSAQRIFHAAAQILRAGNPAAVLPEKDKDE
jgi:antirestriction protein ArdC